LSKRGGTTPDKLGPVDVAVASSVSKVMASTMTYPHEVVRSRLQEQGHARDSEVRYTGVIDCVKKVFRKEGIHGFYRGCATNLMRTTPAAVITFTSFEMILRVLHNLYPPDSASSPSSFHCDAGESEEQSNTLGVKKNDDSVFRSHQAAPKMNSLSLTKKDQLAARH